MSYLTNKEQLASKATTSQFRSWAWEACHEFPLQALIKMGVVPTVSFPADSRYYGTTTLQYTTPDGEVITYLARRFVPQPGRQISRPLRTHTVATVTGSTLSPPNTSGDPLLFWLLCDANGAIVPSDLLACRARVLNITPPQGVPGACQCSRA